MRGRKQAAGALIVMATLLWTGCDLDGSELSGSGGETAATEPVECEGPSGSIRYLYGLPLPQEPDPVNQFDMVHFGIEQNAYDRLIEMTPEGGTEPGLALSVERRSPSVVAYKLREDVEFTDGSSFGVEDVAATLLHYTADDAEHSHKGLFPNELRVETDPNDEMTALVDSGKPQANVPNLLTYVPMLPAEWIRNPDSSDFPPTTGPFQITDRQGGRFILEANRDHWDAPPCAEELIIDDFDDNTARVNALRSGQADIVIDVPPDLASVLEGDPATGILAQNTAELRWVFFRHPMFENEKLRQAAMVAIDREAVWQAAILGKGELADSFLPSQMPGYADMTEVTGEAYEYDPERARQLIEESGVDVANTRLTYMSSNQLPKGREVAELIGKYLNEAGFNVDVEILDAGTYLTEVFGGGGDLIEGTWSSVNFEPDWVLSQWTPDVYGEFNSTVYDSPSYNRCYERQDLEDDPQRRNEIIANECAPILWNELAAVPLWTTELEYGVSSELRGVESLPFRGMLRFKGARASE